MLPYREYVIAFPVGEQRDPCMLQNTEHRTCKSNIS
jgi:hypothetical protein